MGYTHRYGITPFSGLHRVICVSDKSSVILDIDSPEREPDKSEGCSPSEKRKQK